MRNIIRRKRSRQEFSKKFLLARPARRGRDTVSHDGCTNRRQTLSKAARRCEPTPGFEARLRSAGKLALILCRTVVASGAVCTLFAAGSASFADDRPAVRAGLWKFERTLETDGRATDRVLTSGLLYARQVTRCVNPARAIQAETAQGLCQVRDLRKQDHIYYFLKVCGGDAPVKTTINIKSEGEYTEINEGRIGRIASKETIEAHRVADCHPRRNNG